MRKCSLLPREDEATRSYSGGTQWSGVPCFGQHCDSSGTNINVLGDILVVIEVEDANNSRVATTSSAPSSIVRLPRFLIPYGTASVVPRSPRHQACVVRTQCLFTGDVAIMIPPEF